MAHESSRNWPTLRGLPALLESRPGLALLPLRAFMGITFCYAGLQKLADRDYLDKHNPASVVGQMETLRSSSPISWVLRVSLHAPTLVGLVIAFGELAVGLGILLGLWTRLAAVGGIVLSVSFWLTVNWNTHPYFYGPDLFSLFALVPLVGLGSAGVLSLDAWLHDRAMRKLQADPSAAARPATSDAVTREMDRRVLLSGAGVAGIIAVFAGLIGGLTAWLGRIGGGGAQAAAAPVAAPAAKPGGKPAGGAPKGTVVAKVADVPVGQGLKFTDPTGGRPAWVVQTAPGTFTAHSAVCTHAGCLVKLSPGSRQFSCPCHRALFDAATGAVISGPAPKPLAPIPIQVADGQIYAG